MGKSTVAQRFRDGGVPVVEADACVHRLQGPGGSLVPAIESAFPGTPGPGGVNRTALGQAVLGDDAAMKRLEAIVHPAVQAERMAFLTAHAEAPLVVVDVPLLFETGGEKAVDKVLVVSAEPDVQRARVLKRPGMTEVKFDAILARQMPDPEKRARADHVIATDVPLAETREKVRSLIACIAASEGR